MPPKHVVPSIDAKAFSCPHCGALADQSWLEALANPLKDGRPPSYWSGELNRDSRHPRLLNNVDGRYVYYELRNVFVSHCFSCRDIAIWKHDILLYPGIRHEVEPNPDLDPEIQADFDEARAVFSISPRAAAALLRLCLQKLCKQLGQPGKKIDDDIKALVAKGLSIQIQQALDLVRVIGNNAVHPGTINLNDDRETAARLFELVNLIADNQISQPKAIAKLFDEKLTPGAKDAIARRDGSKP